MTQICVALVSGIWESAQTLVEAPYHPRAISYMASDQVCMLTSAQGPVS